MDNFYHNCPPMMEDGGRHLGDFQTATRRNEYIKYINDIWRDDQYRLFLQKHGNEIINREFEYHKKNNSCWANDCVHVYPTRSLPRHMVQERQAYDSVFRLPQHNALTPLRKCTQYEDYRLHPKNC